MNKKKVGIIIIVIVFALIISFFLYQDYANQIDRENFNKTIKTASDLENITDRNYVAVFDKGSIALDDFIIYETAETKNITEEINILEQYKNQTRNDTYKEYLEIQINRLTLEKRWHEADIEENNIIKQYQNGEISLITCTSRRKNIQSQKDNLDNQKDTEKINSINYLEKHPDLNKTLTELDIDEDFNTLEWNETGNNRLITFK